MKNNPPFYVGYIPKMPERLKKMLFPWLVLLVVLSIIIPFILVSQQREFSTSTFELGTITSLEGRLVMMPYPMLKIEASGQGGKTVSQHLLLIGFGKYGAEGTIEVWENQIGQSLNGKHVTINGTLIYHDGKTLLELTNGKQSLEMVFDDPVEMATGPKEEGGESLTGEIVDPKCYFGVMKPGLDKPHRSCAARCIAGGIPPVLRVESRSGMAEYYLIYNENQEHPGDEMLPFVGQQVEIQGNVKRYQDWNILEVNLERGVEKKSLAVGPRISTK